MPSMDTLPPYRAPNYIVWRDGVYYRALNGVTGEIQFQSLDPGQCVLQAFTAGGAGCVVELKEDTFTAVAFSFPFTANNQWLRGSGDGTFLDCDALLTGVHGITLNGYTGCTVSDLSIQTEDGGGKTCYCVWIANGADGFHVYRVTIVNSDANGIHVSGTTISQGHIHHIHVLAADEYGILVDMDAVNFMYRLHIEDCDIGNCGSYGINFAASGGNFYCEIVNNIIYSSSIHGLGVVNYDYSMVRGNILILNGRNGMIVFDASNVQVLGNIAYQNVRHGIELSSADYCPISGNICNENDSGNTGTYDGISLTGSSDNLLKANMCHDNDRWGIMIDADSDRNKVGNNKTSGNTAGSIRVNNANCDNNQIEFNTVEEGAPGNVGTNTRSYGNYDPSANAFVGDVGAAPF